MLVFALVLHYRFAIILTRKRELFSLLYLSFLCLVSVNDMCLFLAVPWVGLQCVIVAFPDHTHFLFEIINFDPPPPPKKI